MIRGRDLLIVAVLGVTACILTSVVCGVLANAFATAVTAAMVAVQQ